MAHRDRDPWISAARELDALRWINQGPSRLAACPSTASARHAPADRMQTSQGALDRMTRLDCNIYCVFASNMWTSWQLSLSIVILLASG